MKALVHRRAHWVLGAGALAFLVLAGSQAVRAEEPGMAIHLAGGGTQYYAVSEIERMVFEGDTLVVVDIGGEDRYLSSDLVRIEFLWGVSSLENPEETAAAFVKAMHLFQNQPNPFSPETRIAFELPRACEAELAIYSPDGRLVRRLFRGERSAGRQTFGWDGSNDAGGAVASGVYFCILRAPGIEESQRMILLR